MFDVPALQIRQQSSQLEFEISDTAGQPLGRASQVSGPKPRKGLMSVFGSGVGDARLVLQVFLADGTPGFYVDRQEGSPVAVVAPDGTVLGRMADDRVGAAQQAAAHGIGGGTLRAVIGAMGPKMRHLLLDGADRPLCALDWTLRMNSAQNDNRQWRPVACDYTDMNGTAIAHLDVREGFHKDEYELQFGYQLPEPLHTLIVASPFAFDLTRS
ncbi:hypothetical protein E1293_20580 [Actinomadura darangshiensis]|uniref:Uncharacterized protein n=1 Tax=Actinomadura darangshiensis TaxID=705336 RepID=A0A4R5B410_9ACTN|nr:hypothetical protein [Actinomadura darangshiensis]TDD80511.1 hypothetical protein E1293_20580 [Actinomadura darangshiensis]